MKIKDMKTNVLYKLKTKHKSIVGRKMSSCQRCGNEGIFILFEDFVYVKKVHDDSYEIYYICHSCFEITYDYVNKKEFEDILKTYDFKIDKKVKNM